MLRRLNYTDRIRIGRSDVRIFLRKSDHLSFDADLSGLNEYDLPPDALVFVEAYRQTTWMRFGFGRVEATSPPVDTRLIHFDSPEGIRFRVKITPEGGAHKILAEADGIPLLMTDQEDAGKEPLLPVKPADLHGEIFNLDFQGNEPILKIDRSAGAYSDLGRSPIFLALVYPSLLKEILVRILIIDEHFEDEPLDGWRARWLRFVRSIPGVGELPERELDQADVLEWIDRAVSAFSRKTAAMERFREFWKEGS